MKSDLHKPIWAVVTPSGATIGLKYDKAFNLARAFNQANGGNHATVTTAAAARRLAGNARL
jgi:hypothetical protein